MDVRQFAFLARQPSAALERRDAFFGLPKRGLALILANTRTPKERAEARSTTVAMPKARDTASMALVRYARIQNPLDEPHRLSTCGACTLGAGAGGR